MNTKFKIGDLIELNSSGAPDYKGCWFVVIDVYDGGTLKICLVLDNDFNHGPQHYTNQLSSYFNLICRAE